MTVALGLDIGSTTTKAALVAIGDEVAILHVAREATPRDADALLAAVARVAAACADAADGPIAAVGIGSMAETGVALDTDARPLTPLLRWDRGVDARHLARLLALLPDLPARTGVPATTKPLAVTLTALRADDPDVFAAMRRWAGAGDLVAHALTGVLATDHTLAARTMMAGAHGSAWDVAALDAVGVRSDALPALRAPGEAVAATASGARAFGLPQGVPVYAAGHDHAVGAWAAGVRSPGAAADSLGTAEAIVRVTDAVDTAAAVSDGFAVGRTVDGSARTIVGGSPSCGAMLHWWDRAHPGDDTLGRLAALDGGRWRVSTTTVLPYPAGRQCPRPDPSARVAVLGAASDADERVHGLLQSLVLQGRWIRDTVDALAGTAAHDLTLIGSLARRIPAWAPLIAAAGAPATFVSAADEPVAAGAALLAAVRAGVASPETRLSRTPVAAADAPDLDHAYRRFLDAVAEGEE